MTERRLSAIVLAAGQGTRMRSAQPKPLHLLCGQPMVRYVLDALADCAPDRAVIVVGHGGDAVEKALQDVPGSLPLEFVEQRVQRGTGDALAVGLVGLPEEEADFDGGDVIVLPGDTPLLRPETLSSLVLEHRLSGAACTVLTVTVTDPTGYGRIVRDKHGRVRRIVEQADANASEREIDEVNTAIYVFRRSLLPPALRRLTPDNTQSELYVTDLVEVLAEAGHPVVSVMAADTTEAQGVNDRAQLATAEAELRRRINERWLLAGVTMIDPAATYVDVGVELAPDVVLLPGTLLQGTTIVGSGSRIGPHTRLVDTRVGERATVTETVARHAEIGPDAVVGPYAILEDGASVRAGTSTGAFYTARTR